MEGCYHHGIVMPLKKKFEIMKEATCFVIPSSFSEQKNSNYRYSFPTKLPELIASNRPIISYGPENTSTNRILTENKIGVLLNKRSVENLTELLLNVIENYSFWTEQAENDRKNHKKLFSGDLIRNKFSRILAVN